jgi:hypothetical protein
MEAATQEFQVDGSWVDPRVTKLARRTGAGASGAPARGADGRAAEGP